MEPNNTDLGSNKDEAMKQSFDSVKDVSEKTEKKAVKKSPPKVLGPIVSAESGKKEPETPLQRILQTEKPKEEKPSALDLLKSEKPPETEAKIGKEPPLEYLSAEEKIGAAGAYVEAGITDTAEEIAEAEPDSQAEIEAAAGLVFLESLEDKLQGQPEINEELLEAATADALEALAIEPGENELTLEDTPSEGAEAEPELETSEDETEPDIEIDPVDTEDDDPQGVNQNVTLPNNPIPPAGGAPIPPVPPSPNTPPPVGPLGGGIPPIIPGGPLGPIGNPNIPNPNMNAQNPNVLPVLAATSMNQLAVERRRNHRGRDLLLGGVVGYMIGRRRGRINTEKRLLPVQAKLEKEVSGLHDAIATQEMKVRALAARQHEINPIRTEKQRKTIEQVKERIAVEEQLAPPEPEEKSEKITIDKDKAKKAEVSLSENENAADRAEKYKEVREQLLTPKTIERLTLPLILEIAEGVKLGDVSLRSMYETGVIDQESLRLVLKKYLDGEKIENIWPKALEKEVIGAELLKEKSLNQQKDNGGSNLSMIAAAEAKEALQTAHESERLGPQINQTTEIQHSSVIQAIMDHDDGEKTSKRKQPVLIGLTAAVILAVLILTVFS